MVSKSICNAVFLAGAAAALGGCVAEAPLSVAPGQGKTYADFQRDDAACRTGPAAPATGSVSTPATATAQTAAPEGTYYQCMAAKGDMVIANRAVAYPAYPAYAGYPYPYAYPAYGYPFGYPYGYPYSAAYLGPYVGLGVGIGIGGYYGGRGWHGGDRGGYHGGGYGGYHGGGYHGGGAIRR